jgi:hypothetical protein
MYKRHKFIAGIPVGKKEMYWTFFAHLCPVNCENLSKSFPSLIFEDAPNSLPQVALRVKLGNPRGSLTDK